MDTVNSLLLLIKPKVQKMLAKVAERFQSFLTSALEEASHPGHFTQKEIAPGTRVGGAHWRSGSCAEYENF
jgi:hypothetical protein